MTKESATMIKSDMSRRTHSREVSFDGYPQDQLSFKEEEEQVDAYLEDEEGSEMKESKWKSRDFSIAQTLIESVRPSELLDDTGDRYQKKEYYMFSIDLHNETSIKSDDTFCLRVVQDSNPRMSITFPSLKVDESTHSLIVNPPDGCTFDPVSRLPWILKPEDLLGHVLSVEVFLENGTGQKVAETVVEYKKVESESLGKEDNKPTDEKQKPSVLHIDLNLSTAELQVSNEEEAGDDNLSPVSRKREKLRRLRTQMRNNLSDVNSP